MRRTFGQIAFFNVLDPKIGLPDWNSRQYLKTVGFVWKLYKTCFSGYAEEVLTKSHFSTFQSQNRSTGQKFTPIRETSRLFIKIVQNVLFGQEDVLAKSHFSTFQIQKLLRGPKLTPIRENTRLSMKIVQNVLFRQCGGRFGQIAFFNVLDQKIALPDWNSREYVKTVGFSWKLYKTCFLGNAEDVLAKLHFSTFQIQKLLRGPKLTPIRENSRLCMKIVQNVLFRPCAGRFDQIAFLNVLDPKIALPDWNSRQYVKTVGFVWKLYKTCFWGHAEDVLTKSHFSTFQSQKSLYGTEIHANT